MPGNPSGVAAGDEQRGKELWDRASKARALRSTIDQHCEDIARRVLPNYVGRFQNRGPNLTPGLLHNDMMYDATGALAITRFSAAMESMLTPQNSQWHSLQPSDMTLRNRRNVQLWFEEVTQALFKYRYAPNANFISQQQENYLALGAFGTGTMFVDQLQPRYGRGVRYRAVHLGEVAFCENHQGMVDTVFREFPLTARQAVQKFGKEALPEKIAQAADDPKRYDEEFKFLHAVTPREDYEAGRLDFRGMPFRSEYVSEVQHHIVEDRGYSTFPYAISRYVIAPGEVYGRSPAMLVLPSLRILNEQKKTVLKQGQRVVEPVLLAHDDGVMDNFSMRGGAINYGGVTADGKPLVHVLPTGNLALGKDMMDDERAVINDAFLVTLFQILVETPEMTATEVVERAREKGALLSPTMGRQQSESLGPMIEREIDLLQQQRLLSPMPDILRQAEGEYTIEYTSPLSRAQKAEGISGFFRVIDWAKEFIAITGDPSPLDWADFDAAMPAIMANQAVPTPWVRDANAVKGLRDARTQQAQQKMMAEAAPSIASVAGKMMPKQQGTA